MYCPKCGTQNGDNNYKCTNCGQILQGQPRVVVEDLGESAGMRMLLPVGRSGLAIAAGYAGLFSLLILPAPVALILGILAVLDIRKNPKKHGMGRAVFAIIIGALGTGLLAFMGISIALGG